MKHLERKGLINAINHTIFPYRYDLLALFFMELILLWVIIPLFAPGHIVFSDIDFPMNARRYLDEIYGLWNSRWNTATMLNIPRLLFILPSWLISAPFSFSGEIFLKTFLFTILQASAISMYLFCKRLFSVYLTPQFTLFMTISLTGASLLYTLNPWVIFRIQHIYLLCGYALFPLMLLFFFNAFDPRFQKQLIYKYSIFRMRLYKRNIIDLMLLGLTVAIMSAAIHYLFYSVLVIVVFAVLLYLKALIIHSRSPATVKRTIFFNFLMKAAVFGIFLLLFSYYWMSPYIGSILTGSGASQHNVNVLDTLSLFSRNSSLPNVLLLISYWWPMFELSSLPISFYLGGGVILTIIFTGAIRYAWKHHIILLFTMLTTACVIFATGVKTELLSEIFITVVLKVPVFGAIFRDPNKLVGLAAAGYSILLAFGLHLLFSLTQRKGKDHSLFRILLVAGVSLSFWFYIAPVHKNFIQGFYAPIEIPEEYVKVQSALYKPDDNESRVLYLPVSDHMIQPGVGVSTPYWNKNPNDSGFEKATGDFHIYSSGKNTVFHHEGNPPALRYYFAFLQNLLDKGLVDNFPAFLKPLGVNELAYHDEYLGQEARQDFNKDVLELQTSMNQTYQNNIFSLYRIPEPLNSPKIIEKAVHTPYGISHIPSYMRMMDFDFSSSGIIFSALQKQNYLDRVRPGDWIEAARYNDLWLSSLPDKFYFTPFDSIDEGNPFLGWAKTLVSTNDWMWYLKSQNIDNFPYDFAFDSGIAVTFSSAKLNVPPYRRSNLEGKNILDFNSMLRLDLFFRPDNPQLFQVTPNPISPFNKIPLLHGEIVQGDTTSIWQAARSGKIEAKPNTPYQFKILISGRGTNKLHVKVRFYDEDMNELGISYVVAPREETSYDALNLYSEYISPPESRFMRLELQSFQRPEQKVYWWIHDVKITDLGDYAGENTFRMNFRAEQTEEHTIFMRALKSRKGGTLAVKNKTRSIEINTEDPYLNQFEWISLGKFLLERGDNFFDIQNISNFNAVNLFAVIPESRLEESRFLIERAADKGRLFFALEAENDFSYQGNIQSERRYPHLSLGNAVASQSGILSRKIDILKNAHYDLRLNLQGLPDRNRLDIQLQKTDGTQSFQQTIELDVRGKTLSNFKTVEYTPSPDPGEYTRQIISLPGGVQSIGVFEVNGIPLTAGEYELAFRFDSRAESLSPLESLHYFDPSEVKIPSFFQDILQEDCSDCEHIDESMIQKKYSDGLLRLDYDKTCSCDWYVYSSDKLSVEPYLEYLLIFEAKSEVVRRRHSKIFFLDKNDQILLTSYIPEVDESEKSGWNTYEHIVTAPEGAVNMLFQVWARGNKVAPGFLEMRNYEILRYRDLLKIDSFLLSEQQHQAPETCGTAPGLKVDRKSPMASDIFLEDPSESEKLILFPQPAIPLWHLRTTEAYEKSALQLNGVSTGFYSQGNGRSGYRMRFRKHYYAGLLLFILGFPAARLLYKRSASPLPWNVVAQKRMDKIIHWGKQFIRRIRRR